MFLEFFNSFFYGATFDIDSTANDVEFSAAEIDCWQAAITCPISRKVCEPIFRKNAIKNFPLFSSQHLFSPPSVYLDGVIFSLMINEEIQSFSYNFGRFLVSCIRYACLLVFVISRSNSFAV